MTPTAPEGFVARYTDTWRRVMTEPHAFFADMPQTGGLGEPATFLAVSATLNGLGHLLLGSGFWGGLVAVTVVQVVITFLLAAVLVVIAQNLFEGRAGFEPTLRVAAFAAAPLVLGWVPLLGEISQLYSAYLIMRGVERVHAIDTIQAVLTVGLSVGAIWLVLG